LSANPANRAVAAGFIGTADVPAEGVAEGAAPQIAQLKLKQKAAMNTADRMKTFLD
jgi:hypothetical protein